MENKRLAAAGVVLLLVLTGYGCRNVKTSEPSGSSRGSSYSSSDDAKQTPAEAYRNATDLDFGTSDNSRALEAMVSDVFGDVKTTSFAAFPSPNSVTAEYQAKRLAENADMQKVVDAIKKKGYTVNFSGASDGVVTVSADNKNNNLWITFQIGESKIGGSLTPINELNGESYEE